MAHLYFTDRLGDASVGGIVTVEGQEARHAATVSRIRPGEGVLVGDGRGTLVAGFVEAASPSALQVRVARVDLVPAPAREVVLVQALAKGDRDELAVQAATELGVDRIIPWQAERSVSRWAGPKVEKGRERWASIAREAGKQSLRAWIPDVAPLAGRRELEQLAGTHTVLLLEPTASVPFADAIRSAGNRPLAIVVGPEGGISGAELDALTAAGAVAARLGPTVLRTSTAGPAALAALAVLTGRWT